MRRATNKAFSDDFVKLFGRVFNECKGYSQEENLSSAQQRSHQRIAGGHSHRIELIGVDWDGAAW